MIFFDTARIVCRAGSVQLSGCLSVRPSVCLSVRLSVCLSVRVSVCLSVRPSVPLQQWRSSFGTVRRR